MRLTSKSSYGIRALVDLAILHDGNKPVTLKKLAGEEGISLVYLEQIFNRLKKQGIVKSVRGPGGGYVLSRSPERVSIYDAVEALEGGMRSVGCISARRNGKSCARLGNCASREVWEEITVQLQEVLAGVSLGQMARRTLEKDPDKLKRIR